MAYVDREIAQVQTIINRLGAHKNALVDLGEELVKIVSTMNAALDDARDALKSIKSLDGKG